MRKRASRSKGLPTTGVKVVIPSSRNLILLTRMRKIILVAILFLVCGCVFAQDTLKSYSATRTASVPKIDGVLDESCWVSAPAISDFVQLLPIEGSHPKQRTEVKIVYDDKAVYIGAMLYDTHPDSILHELGFRDDDGLNADRFRIVFDPYNTRQDGYVFEVYASGVQKDFRFSDPTFDAVWQSEVKINEQGWCIEMKIPYSAIRFPRQEIQVWAMQCARDIRRTREYDQWCLTPSNQANPFKFFGNLKGIEHVDPPLRLSMTPYLSTYADRSPFYYNASEYQYANSAFMNYGADIKYGIDERFTVDMTLLPDFGQVQSDNKVKNLSYREINYDENRPFFKEGTELFNKQGLFYSRRIGKTPSGFYDVPYLIGSSERIVSNPSKVRLLNATKLSGRTDKGLGIGILNAVTADMYAEVEDTVTGAQRKILTEPLTNYNVFVLDQQLKHNSNFYFINTNVMRDKGYDDANVSAAGYTLFNKKNSFATDGNFSLSQHYSADTSRPNSVNDQVGFSYFIGVRKTGGNFEYGIGHEVMNDTYDRKDMGYFNVNNYSSFNYYFNYNLYKPWKFLRQSFNSFSFHHSDNYITRQLTDLSFNYNSYFMLKNYLAVFWGANVNPVKVYDYYEPRVPGRWYMRSQAWFAYWGLSTDYRKKFALDLNVNGANFFRHNTGNFPALFCYGGGPALRYRFSDKLSVKYSFNYNLDPYNDGFADIDVNGDIIIGGRTLHTYENKLSVKYIFRNNMSLGLNARHYWNTGEYKKYYTLGALGYLFENTTYTGNRDFNYNAFNIDLVYSWQFAPGSLLTIVYKNAIEQDMPVVIHKFSDNFSQTMQSPQVNSFSVKLLYYLDYQYLIKKK